MSTPVSTAIAACPLKKTCFLTTPEDHFQTYQLRFSAFPVFQILDDGICGTGNSKKKTGGKYIISNRLP
jgi:hypothetical protein